MIRKLFKWGVGAALLLFLLIQLVPYGRAHNNPPVRQEPTWDSPQTQALAERACYDCHSNETEWPWYSNVAPVSWLLQHDVIEGRSKFNVSEWGREQDDAEEAAKTVAEGEMPPPTYLLSHPTARLTESERAALVQGLQATFGGELEDGD